MEAINQVLQSKLHSLVFFLDKVTTEFYVIAEEIDNTNLKTAMIAVAVESDQYAKEIINQLQAFDIIIPTEHTNQVWNQIEMSNNEQDGSTKGGEILSLCNNCEIYFGKLYKDVLQEYFPYKILKDIITYQLYATQYAFMKIRLLNALRFNH